MKNALQSFLTIPAYTPSMGLNNEKYRPLLRVEGYFMALGCGLLFIIRTINEIKEFECLC